MPLSQFQGVGGAAIVSVIAFTIVFIVLAGLTAVIYAIKFFAGGASAPQNTGGSVAPSAPKQAASGGASPVAGAKSQITAAITAAILASTGGRGRILSITPSSTACETNRVWRTTGIVERISGRLSRPWKH